MATVPPRVASRAQLLRLPSMQGASARFRTSVRTPKPRQQVRCISAYGYEQAKALVYSDYGQPGDVLSLHGHSIPPAHSNLVTIRFLASPLNPADINTIQGVYPQKPTFTTALSTPQPVAVPGNEGVAEVISAGASAKTADGTALTKGDWVLMRRPAYGTWRTHAQAPAADLVRLDAADRAGVSAIAAGTVSVNPCTAWAMLRGFIGTGERGAGAPVAPGQWFVQNGANSGVGRAAIQLGRAWGLKSVNVVRSRPDGEGATRALKDELRGLGADVVVTEEEAADKGFPELVRSHVGDARVALGLNCVGGRSALNLAKVLSPAAWLLTYGAMAKQPLSVPGGMLIFKDLRFGGFWVSRWADACPDEKLNAVKEVLALTREGRFKDTPVQEVRWDHGTKEDVLKDAVIGTLEGFRGGKSVFVFGDT